MKVSCHICYICNRDFFINEDDVEENYYSMAISLSATDCGYQKGVDEFYYICPICHKFTERVRIMLLERRTNEERVVFWKNFCYFMEELKAGNYNILYFL